MESEILDQIYEIEEIPTIYNLIFEKILEIKYFDVPIIIFFLFLLFWFLIFLKFKSSLTISTIQFLISIYLVYITESLNNYFIKNWTFYKFSKNYFDENCIFLFIFWALPFSIISSLITFQLFLDLCKSIAVHQYFNSILQKKNENIEKIKKE